MEICEISDAFRVRVVEKKRPLEPALKRQVDAIWDKRGAGLFDGQILSASSVIEDEIVAHLIPYRQFFAAEKEPALREQLNICAVAVTGIVRSTKGKILLGRRSHKVTQYPDYWELAPSGSLDASSISGDYADFRGQILSELKEETGLEQVSSCTSRFLAKEEGVIDLCLELTVQGTPRCQSDEYQSLQWVDKEELPELKGKLVPLAHDLLRNGLLRAATSGIDHGHDNKWFRHHC